jgi:glycosyltransferase involved in cell wall biosynthesis
LRICFVSSYPPNRARLSEYAQDLAKEIANRPKIDEMYLLIDKSVGLDCPIPNDNSKIKIRRIWKADDSLSILGIIIYVLKLRPQVVHFNIAFQSYGRSRLANFTGISLIFLCRLLGFKVLVGLHNLADKVDLEKVNVKPTFLNRMGILVATKLILSAPKVVVTVRSYANYLKMRYGHLGVQYIPHGAIAKNSLQICPGEKVILIFGFMGPHKGLSVLLKAFEELSTEKTNVKLVVAGSDHPNFPGFLNRYAKLNNPKVEFLGYVCEENIVQVFGKTDVVVIPYLTMTGTSGVFHLACGYGKPIVSSDLPEIRELLDEGAAALLVPPNDAHALKNAMLKVLSNDKLAARMASRNLLFAQRESWGIVAEAFEEAYLELLNT